MSDKEKGLPLLRKTPVDFLSPEEARRAARREFGHIDSLQEQARDARGARWIESLVADEDISRPRRASGLSARTGRSGS